MDKQQNPDKQTVAHFGRAVRDFACSEVGGRAKWMVAVLYATAGSLLTIIDT